MQNKGKKIKVVSCKLSQLEHEKFTQYKKRNNLNSNTKALRHLILVAIEKEGAL